MQKCSPYMGNAIIPERASRPNEGDAYASVQTIKAFLDGHIRLRYNEVTGRVEYLSEEAAESWLPITDRIVNSLWSEMSQSVPCHRCPQRSNKRYICTVQTGFLALTDSSFRDYDATNE